MIKIYYHPYFWQIKPHRSEDGRPYLQDMDIKPKWLADKIQKRHPLAELTKCKPLRWSDYNRVHTRRYIETIKKGDPKALEKYSWITWSKSYLRSQKYISGAIYQAAIKALDHKIAGVLAVEGHHALPDKGSGFCTFNNLAVAIAKLLKEKAVKKVMIIDLDLHLGDGTISIFKNNPLVYIYDIFGQHHVHGLDIGDSKNSVSHKVTNKDEYFEAVDKLILAIDTQLPEIVFYVAGMDVYKNDRYGGISGMDKKAIFQRDQKIFSHLKLRKIPTVFTLGGGYVKYKDSKGKVVNREKIRQRRNTLTNLHLSTILSAYIAHQS
jgi:acetoin utilization deacetylase AcuC-like enzyme